jgi:proteasome lid subunit RPN8/RPN11
VRVSQAVYDELIAHARADAPNECCGMLGLADARLTAYFPARNEFASPQRFRIESSDQIRIYNEILSRGEEPAIYHSHPHTEGRPSQTDINLARDWPGSPWVICSLAGDEPAVRAFRIEGNEVEEVELVVD